MSESVSQNQPFAERPDVPAGLIVLQTSERLILRIPPRAHAHKMIERAYQMRWALFSFALLVALLIWQGETPQSGLLMLVIFIAGLSYNLKDGFIRQAASRQLQIKIEGQNLRFEVQNLDPESLQPQGEPLIYQMEYSDIERFKLGWDGRLKMWVKAYSGNILPPIFLLPREWAWVRTQAVNYLEQPSHT